MIIPFLVMGVFLGGAPWNNKTRWPPGVSLGHPQPSHLFPCFLSVKAAFREEPEKATALGFTEVVTDENRRVQSRMGADFICLFYHLFIVARWW